MTVQKGQMLELTVAQIVENTEAEGPGRRFAIWVQGCPMRCPGCCNPEMLAFDGKGGQPTDIRMLADQVLVARDKYGIEGVSLLGGEPFAHAVSCAELVRLIKTAAYADATTKLSLMIFSGYTLEEIQALAERNEPGVRALLEACDLLVDGRYDRDLPDQERRWIGSTNQRMHFLSDRYRADDPALRLRTPNTVEIRLRRGELVVNGWPAGAALVPADRTWRRRP